MSYSPSDSRSSAPVLARFSLWLPLFVFMLAGALRAHVGKGEAQPIMALLGWASIFAALAGFGFGIAALCHRREGETGVVGRSVAGLVLSCSLIAMAALGFAHGFSQAVKARQLSASVSRTLNEASAEVRRSFDSTNGIKAGPETFDKAITAVNKASRELPGESGQVMEASAAYLAELQRITKLYQAESKKLQDANILDPAALTDKRKIGEKRQVVHRFLQVNEELDRFCGMSEKAFRKELTKRGISQQRIDREVRAFHRGAGNRAVIHEIRDTDRAMGGEMLNLLILLEKEWGHWNYDSDTKEVLFSEPAALDRYKASLDAITSNGNIQLALQKQLHYEN